jgi:hypothetical protein
MTQTKQYNLFIILFVAVLILIPGPMVFLNAYETEHVVVVLIDGVRYSESLEDTTGIFMPFLTELSQYGVVHDSAFNDSVTVTRFGVPGTWMGRWYPLQDSTYQGNEIQFCRYPTYWEYARYDLGLTENKAVYITPNYGASTWRPSFYPPYGPVYWPYFSQPNTSNDNNRAVVDSAVTVIQRDYPVISYVYFPDTDHAGHSGIWADYLAEIKQADSLTAELWNIIQSDSIMTGKTTMFVTNDHGRHDDSHGGFSGHGDQCFGCRHVMLFGMGPDFIRGAHVADTYASITDIVRTAGELLGFDPVYSTGRILTEFFDSSSCDYIIGDINDNGIFNGLDITFGVGYFKGGVAPPYLCECTSGDSWFVAGDVNGSCEYNGLDITFGVNYFKGGGTPVPCPDCPPSN